MTQLLVCGTEAVFFVARNSWGTAESQAVMIAVSGQLQSQHVKGGARDDSLLLGAASLRLGERTVFSRLPCKLILLC